MFTSFGFFRDDADNQRVLDNVAASLQPGRMFVLDMVGKECLARVFTQTSSRDLPDALVVHRHRVVDDWTRVHNDWIIIRDGHSRMFQLSHWIYSAREIKDMFRLAGFADARVYGDLAGASYGADAKRLVVVGRRSSL